MLHADLIAKLIALQTDAADRVHHEVVPQGIAIPFLATTVIFEQHPTTLDGRRLLSSAQIRVAIFARDGDQLETLKQQIRRPLNGFRSRLLGGPPDSKGISTGTRVVTLRVETSSDAPAFQDGDKLIKGAALDLFFKYHEE